MFLGDVVEARGWISGNGFRLYEFLASLLNDRSSYIDSSMPDLSGNLRSSEFITGEPRYYGSAKGSEGRQPCPRSTTCGLAFRTSLDRGGS